MDKIKRKKTKVIRIGDVLIGGNNPVAIQSMVKARTSDIKGALKQINELAQSGCEIVRLAVKDTQDARALKAIKKQARIPLVADIHFDWRLALEAIDSGVDKIRLNPGNIYKKDQIARIARAAKLNGIPIRVGLNSGSVDGPGARASSQKPLADKMVKSALGYIRILEKAGFYDIVVSLKGSNAFDTIEAYRRMSRLCDCPLHLGVTATGSPYSGAIKSAAALSILLFEGIGDTIRVSLTDKPQSEIKAAKAILEALDLRCFGPEIISCPTCGRCEVDLVKVVKELENRLLTIDYKLFAHPLKLAVMGCVVNGPGEAKQADIGVAFGRKDGLLFRKGKAFKKVSIGNCADILIKELYKQADQ
jgi:(E)-4-hydroxy-3-methylbut-2-enyl-diphosphate synthase